MATAEAPIHRNVKDQIVANDALSTQIVFREFRNTSRVARNTVSAEIARRSCIPGATFDDVAELASGVRGRAEVLEKGNMEGGMWWASQAQGLIHDVPGCAELVASIIAEAQDIVARLQKLVLP
jgi:nitronate monooxygenase